MVKYSSNLWWAFVLFLAMFLQVSLEIGERHSVNNHPCYGTTIPTISSVVAQWLLSKYRVF